MAGGTGAEAGRGGDGGSGGDADTCDESSTPGDDPCIVDEDFGVFVSARDGNDRGGNGTRAKPYATITKALDVAASTGRPDRVFVCADSGAYEESITLNETLQHLQVFGGFRCSDWTYDTDLKAVLEAPSATAVTLTGLDEGIHLENLEIKAADGAEPGESSFALFVRESENISLLRVELVAGSGAPGLDGADGAMGAPGPSAATSQRGISPTCDGTSNAHPGGVWDTASSCGSRGGGGGLGLKGESSSSGTTGAPSTDVNPPNVDNGGQSGLLEGQDGGPGSPGNAGAPGSPSTEVGLFSSDGFEAPAAGDGTAGFPGQGGGGGGASQGGPVCIGASGGAGGMGGCGGRGGKGGSGGGASVALFSWDSLVTLENCVLTAASGGRGGAGGAGGLGAVGKDGGAGGEAYESGSPGRGGNGGRGGDGGIGGPGAGGNGGPSYALVYNDAEPTLIDTELIAGEAGSAGPGGKSGAFEAEPGYAGLSDNAFEVP